MRVGYLQGVVPTDYKVRGVPSGGMPGQGKNPGNIEEASHALTLEVGGGHHAGGYRTVAAV